VVIPTRIGAERCFIGMMWELVGPRDETFTAGSQPVAEQ
jgi:hypothetical protein